jgi:hypothetical protein
LRVGVKVMLAGPYNTGTDEMDQSAAWRAVLDNTFPGGHVPGYAVDTITIELRDSVKFGSPTKRGPNAPAWLLTDGMIRSFTDTTKSYVEIEAPVGSYYVVVRHRNHLAIMSANPVALSHTAALYDFTTAQTQAYGTAPMQLVGTKYAMYSGDANQNGVVSFTGSPNDRDNILLLIGFSDLTNSVSGVYNNADFNLDGTVNFTGSPNDRDFILRVIGFADLTNSVTTQVP